MIKGLSVDFKTLIIKSTVKVKLSSFVFDKSQFKQTKIFQKYEVGLDKTRSV